MYLKNLSIHGFKSFAHKTLIEFDRGVTGIVGPNGCGKSNVVDAIRWVLGETSAKALRGSEMADVIFSGTEKRKPLSMAEVTLTLAECQNTLKIPFDEVAITRRVFRDGRSEYRINQNICRLKDINDLFMDTGIGRTTYSIMAQGQIDQILSSKPEERRLVFEEAAGITKFKREKKDSLRKLELTEINLIRLTDILNEQEKHLTSLRRQATKARQFQTISHAHQTLDLHLSHHEFSSLNLQKNTLTTTLQTLTTQTQQLETSLTTSEENRLQAQTSLLNLQSKLQQLQHALQHHRHTEQQTISKIEFSEEKSHELLSRIEQNQSDISLTEEKLSLHQDQLNSAHLALEALSSRILQQQSQLAQQEALFLETKQRRTSQESQLQLTQQQLQLTQNSTTSQQARLEFSHSQLETLQQRSSQIKNEIQSSQLQLEEKKLAQSQLEASLQHFSQQKNQHNQTLQIHQNSISSSQQQLLESRKSLESLQKQHTQTQSKLDLTQQWLNSGKGLNSGTQAILRGLDQPQRFLDGIRGLLPAHLTIAPEHQLAIEAALSHQLDTILITHTDFAETLLLQLQSKNLGNARLFALDLIPPTTPTPKPALPKNAIAWASNLISTTSPAANLIHLLLEKTLLVPDLHTAKQLHSTHPSYHFITPQGFSLTPNGLLSGGSYTSDAPSPLTHQIEVKQLEQQLALLHTQLVNAQQLHQQQEKNLEAAQAAHEESREKSHHVLQQLTTLQAEHTQISREISQLTHHISSLQAEHDQLTHKHIQSQESQSSLLQDLEKNHSLTTSLQLQLQSLQQSLLQTQQQDESLIQQVQELRTQLAVERRTQQNTLDQQAPMQARLLELQNLILRRTQEISDLKSKTSQTQHEISSLQKQLTQSQALAEETTYQISTLQESLPQHEQNLQSLESNTKSLSSQLHTLHQQTNQQHLELTKIKLQLDHLLNTTQERHSTSLPDFSPNLPLLLNTLLPLHQEIPSLALLAKNLDPQQIDWLAAKKSLHTLHQQLSSIGPVNLDAITEFDQLNQSHQFIVTQHLDLTQSKKDLLSILEKLNTETQRLFLDAFTQIRENFRTMFRQLFGDLAKADLLLIDQSNPLESGIDIIAKPPGKKLQSISLLSGGERSMTAVALLFSIYRLKPSPFCVLDELDAPLDEANIDRFVKVLDHFIDHSQFIIVTHSKRTMNRADALYGVTMEELGISKPVSMKITDFHQKNPQKTSTSSAQKAASRLTTHDAEE